MSNKLIFYTQQGSNRLDYTLHLVFTDLLGLDIFVTKSKDIFINSNIAKINFSNSPISDTDFFIKAHPFIFENTITSYDFNSETFAELDIFSRIFYLVSRYEEYDSSKTVLKDVHNRFPAAASLAKKLNFLYKPIVNEWVMELKNNLCEKYPHLIVTTPQYKFQPTYDIDQAWAFKNKGFIRNIGGFLKEAGTGHMMTAFRRFTTIIGINNDPEYTFNYLETLHKKQGLKPIFFWLLGDYGAFDKNIDWQNRQLQGLIRRIAKKYWVGIHPSYLSNTSFSILKNEINRLLTIAPKRNPQAPTLLSRQHFLKLSFPETYQHLLKAGVTDDFSMGYADDIGFRASIATSYYWYDLENEQITHLKIHPFAVMEVTLQQYLKLTPDESSEYVKPLVDATKAVNGTFMTLWHNSTLSNIEEWKGWRALYEKIILYSR